MVGPTEEQAREKAEAEGYEIGVSQGSFKANSKALAEGAGDGIAKVIFKKDTYEVIAVHIVGLHAADLIQEWCVNCRRTELAAARPMPAFSCTRQTVVYAHGYVRQGALTLIHP